MGGVFRRGLLQSRSFVDRRQDACSADAPVGLPNRLAHVDCQPALGSVSDGSGDLVRVCGAQPHQICHAASSAGDGPAVKQPVKSDFGVQDCGRVAPWEEVACLNHLQPVGR